MFFLNIDTADPGLIFLFSDDDDIHQVLGLPAVQNIQGLTQGKEKHLYTRITDVH